MANKQSFTRFAPQILQVYRRDKEAFWAAVMAPFLVNDFSPLAWLSSLKVDLGLLSAFKGFDRDARLALAEFGAKYGVDVSAWKSNRSQYLKDAYPVFAFLAVWMDEAGLVDLLANFGEILQAAVYAVAGYGILDANVDSDAPSPVEILAAQALIAEYERFALHIFGVSKVNLDILQQMRSLFLKAEINEKSLRHIASPYRLEKPEELGAKGANAVTPFMLSLERIGKAHLIDDYWQVFLLFGAAIQMIDDWQDLESDLAAGHYSYLTIGVEGIKDISDPAAAAQMLRQDRPRVSDTYACSKRMLAQSREILARLDDSIVVRLVDVTEARLDAYFYKKLHLTE